MSEWRVCKLCTDGFSLVKLHVRLSLVEKPEQIKKNKETRTQTWKGGSLKKKTLRDWLSVKTFDLYFQTFVVRSVFSF